MRCSFILAASAAMLALAAPAQAQNTALSGNDAGIDALLDYVLPLVLQERGSAPLHSAMLTNPAAMDGERDPCPAGERVVVLDLDPAGGLAPLDTANQAPAALAEAVAYLRTTGVAVAWISGHPEIVEGSLRRVLMDSALDPDGQDRLLLMRDAGDRKQERRKAFAKTHCVVAIGGDAHSDFDELFHYLKNPADAAELAPLLGAGWFLLPQPFPQS